MWLVFLTEEMGGNGHCGYDYDNGSHSAVLCGVYSTEEAAEEHADDLREDDDDDDEPTYKSRRVEVVRASTNSTYTPGCKSVWEFEANTDLEAPRNYGVY